MISKCTLDHDHCIDLLSVLRVVNQIDQEQAWALCYSLAQLMERLLPLGTCAPIESLGQVHLHRDGYVHEKSCLLGRVSRPATATRRQLNNPEPLATTKDNHQHPCPHHNTSSPEARDVSRLPQLPTPERITSTPAPDASTPVATTPETNNNNHTGATNHHHHQPHQKARNQHPTPLTPPITPELELLNETPGAVEPAERAPNFGERELVASLGIALFWALDYEIPDDQERKLNRAMECLIFQSQSELRLAEVLEVCRKRLPVATKMYADAHYRNVCKSLISDTLDLSVFLEKIYTATMALGDINHLDGCLDAKKRDSSVHHHHHLGEVDDLSILSGPLNNLRAQWRINDWARLWMQVIRELRQRGRFKQALLVN